MGPSWGPIVVKLMTPDSIALALTSLPPLFWPAVIAAAISAPVAFLGVLVSNRSNAKRLLQQLEHDSLEKSRERIGQMRRTVYLQAAAEMSKAMAHLGNIPQLDPRSDNLAAPLLSFNSVAAQVQLIAESHTANLLAEMGQRLASIFFEMIGKAQPMFALKFEAEMHESMRDFAKREFDQLIGEAKAMNASNQTDDKQSARISRSIDSYKVQIETHTRLMVECLDKRLTLQKKYASELLSEVQPIVEAQIPLMVQIRKELELTSNTDEIATRTRAGFADFKVMLNKALSKLS